MAVKTYPGSATAADAIVFAWEGVFFQQRLDRPAALLLKHRLGDTPPEMQALDVVMLEHAIRAVLRVIGDAVRSGQLIFDAVHPDHHRRFPPDPVLLEDLSAQDRVLNRITLPDGKTILDLRFHKNPEYDANQLSLSLPQPPTANPPDATGAPPAKRLSREEALHHQIRKDGLRKGDAIPEQTFGKAVRKLAEEDALSPHGIPKRGWGDKHLARLARKILTTEKF
jgi:hypothetical protein